MSVVVECGECRKRMRAPVTLAGKRVRCKCGARISVPFPNEASQVAERPQAGASPVARADRGDAGAKPIRKPGEPSTNRFSPPGDSTPDDFPQPADLSDLALLGDGESLASSKSCPECFTTMAEDAVICTACGYDVRTGRKIRAAEERSVEKHRGKAGALAESSDGKTGKAPSKRDPAAQSKLAMLVPILKPLLILGLIAGLACGGWYLKDSIFFNPRDQLNEDHAKITPGMTVDQVVAALEKKPKLVETVRPPGQSKDLLLKLTPKKLPYVDNFMTHYTKDDLQYGFAFTFIYSQRDELFVYFDDQGTVMAAEKHDPMERLGL
ncbi:MAG TPA: hypothetical protein VNT79_12305 [Phycisphaerae bacterium]|nr:hypothetical protein [Phycisphaerae bacterium]